MTTTAAGTTLLAIARDAGCTPYDVTEGFPTTSKLARLRTSRGIPIAIQINNKTPRIWLLPEHYNKEFSALGLYEDYPAGKGRHHHLNQIREFRGRPLAKIVVSTTRWPDIRAALSTGAGMSSPPE